ncbi:RNA polymerase sigma factor [Natronincola ferrireducens]|uniref:RNA polymerase sigma-70 factor, ECF subfamily n=1 Tax=Natronincola ferrireducens TaxID=393762 RepID=A0A1G9DWA4_9FIRM|nr:RNA polymerase sigma factor [Natronincola ferrireducens]SDK68137.1 RNA polymerase sigma-70 factor, ECF subfamily [Natronincola ferrireducens]
MAINQLLTNIINIKNRDKNTATKSIIKEIKKNQLNNFFLWMEMRKNKYYKIAWSYLYNHHDIEDVFQITIMKVYENIHQLREEKYFETWVTSIFLNECKSLLRKRQREVFVDTVDEANSGGNTYIECPGIDANIELKEKLDQLEDIYRQPIILKYISGYSQEEISKILEIPIGTVKSRIYRGLKMLKVGMDKEV